MALLKQNKEETLKRGTDVEVSNIHTTQLWSRTGRFQIQTLQNSSFFNCVERREMRQKRKQNVHIFMRRSISLRMSVNANKNTRQTHIFLQLQVRKRRGEDGRGHGSGYPVNTFGRPVCCSGNERGCRRSCPPQRCPGAFAVEPKK